MSRDKVDTGAFVTCMPLSMLRDIGLDEKDLVPDSSCPRGVAGTDMKTRDELTARVSCNSRRLHKEKHHAL